MPDNRPYKLQDVSEQKALVTFNKGDIQQLPSEAEREELVGVVRKHEQTVIDLTQTDIIGTRWLVCFARMTSEAKATSGFVRVVGAKKTTRDTADLIAAKLDFADSVETAWAK
jgi:anti-anti-sigma regulatory factor